MSAPTSLGHLDHLLDHLAHFLPAQGPIGVFIHHNTLHAFQGKPFEEAVVAAARLFQAEPYMREEAFREAFVRGRIQHED
ncbi:MAG: Na-translocating system protein MpsB, partial [Bryobacteraceae bacterium]|nr:Na-translocating system protein MpsB [Bryobacteraceae bacterium]